MANTKSAKKAVRVSERKATVNKMRKSRIHTFMRKVKDAIGLGKQDEAKVALKNLEPELMKGVNKGIVKKNTASRKLSRLSTQVKSMGENKSKKIAETKSKKSN